MSITDLETQLIHTGYMHLFLYGNRSLADAVWDNGRHIAALENIIVSGTTSSLGKFLAAELLRKYKSPLPEAALPVLAAVYTAALKNTGEDNSYGLSGNLWGFLYAQNDSGHLGSQLVHLGEAAVPYLISLLDHTGPVLYEGSEEATIGNDYQYRVKDFAAFYISKIRNIPVRFYRNHADRDREIGRLKTLL